MANMKSSLNTIGILVCLAALYFWWTDWRLTDDDKAYKAAKAYITEQLKAPGSADFPGDPLRVEDDAYNASKHLYGYVDAKNPLGVMIRTRWHAEVKRAGNDWQVVNLETN